MPRFILGFEPEKLESLKKDDVIMFSKDVTFQSPKIQALAKQNAITGYKDPRTGADIGVRMTKPFVKPETIQNAAQQQAGSALNLGNYGNTTPTGLFRLNQRFLQGGVNELDPQRQQDVLNEAVRRGLTIGNQANSTTPEDLLASQEEAIRNAEYKNIERLNMETERAKRQAEMQREQDIQGAKDVGGRISGGLTRLLGRSGGLTDTSGAQVMAQEQRRLGGEIQELKNRTSNLIAGIENARASGRADIEQQARAELQQLQQAIGERQQAQAEALVAIQKEQRLERGSQADIAKINFDITKQIPRGEEVTIGNQTFTGIKPKPETKAFFSGANIVSMMSQIPAGKSQTIKDPNTGTEWTISGTDDINVKVAEDPTGKLTGINTQTGDVMWELEGRGKGFKGQSIGTAKSTPAGVSPGTVATGTTKTTKQLKKEGFDDDQLAQIEQLKDPEVLAQLIIEAEAKGEIIGAIGKELDTLGIPRSVFSTAIKRAREIKPIETEDNSFFNRLMNFGSNFIVDETTGVPGIISNR